MIIRKFKRNDEKYIIELWDLCNLIVPSNNPIQDIKRKMTVNPHLFLVGEIDGRIISSVMGGYDGHRGWINYLAVHPEYRRNGHGKKLMINIEALLKKNGCPKINLQIRANNNDVIKFYQGIGFIDDKVISLGKRLTEDREFNG